LPYSNSLPSGQLIKIAHYQEANATQEVIPSSLTTLDPTQPGANSAQKLVPVPGSRDAGDEDPDGDEPDGPDGKPPGPKHPVPPPPAPAHNLRPPPGARGMSPFENGSPNALENPFGPEPSFLPPLPGMPGAAASPMPLDDGSTLKVAVRNPCLAPLPPQPNPFNAPQPIQPWQLNPKLPLMSYARLFDGADADLVAALRDYVELSGDLRSGGWEEYLHRTEDFIRFTSYRMILEMLSLHGGEGKHRLVLKFRKYK
jgi:hypothetical protein